MSALGGALAFIYCFFVFIVYAKKHENVPHHQIEEHYHPIAHSRSATGTPPASDIEALVEFYQATNGNQWTINSGWPNGNPCGGWYGITCDPDSNRVSSLLLSNNNLVGTLPHALELLKGLKVIDVSFNSLSSSIPRNVFSSLTLFRELYLNNNQFKDTLEFFDDLPADMEVIYIPDNQFYGTVPATIGKFTKTHMFQVFSNELTGTIPPEIGSMIALESLDFGFNQISGSIPTEIGNLVNLVNFWIYDAMISGSLPDSMGALTKLQIFEITRNQLTGTLPDTFGNMESLEILRLGGNSMTGIPAAICHMTNLSEITLYKNKFTGVPACSSNQKLAMLLFGENELVGSIPSELGLLSSLKRLDLSHNQLSGTVPDTFANMGELIFIDLSHNNFSCGLKDMMLPFARLSRITSVDVSNNQISGEFPRDIVWNDSTQEELSNSVTYLYLNNNQMHGPIPSFISWMYRLAYLDMSYNNFSGPIPETLSYLSALYVEDNPYLFGEGGAIPSFLEPDFSDLTKSIKGDMVCPGLRGKTDEYKIRVDPSYFNYHYCKCEPTYRGTNGSCTLCPEHTTCDGSGNTTVDPGYYPYPDFKDPTYIIKCTSDNFGFTPCNPNKVYPFACKKGYEGRLCSKCNADYFSRGIECLECLNRAPQVIVIILLACVVISGYLFFLLTRPTVSLPSAARKTGIFYFQALNLLLTRFAGWPKVFSFLATVSSIFNFGFNYTCLIFDYYAIYYVTLGIPIFCAVVNGLLLAMMKFAKIAYGTQVAWEKWSNGAARTFLLTLNFMYLPLCTITLSMFVCEEDSYNQNKYLAAAPFIQCSNSKEYAAAVSVGVVCFILYVLGIPALFGFLLFRNRKSLEEHKILASIGSLYVDYTEKSYYYELVGLFRRFLFALVITVINQENLFLMSAILFCVLVANTLAQIRFKPFNYHFSNIIELIGLGLLIFNLVAILSTTSNSTTSSSATLHKDGDPEIMVMQILVLMVNLAYILLLLMALFFGVSQMVLPKRWRNTMESISSLAYITHVQTRKFELPPKKDPKMHPTIVVHVEDNGSTTFEATSDNQQNYSDNQQNYFDSSPLPSPTRSSTSSMAPLRPDNDDDEDIVK